METIVSKWGNSLALRLPKRMSSSLRIVDGSKVNIHLKKNKIEITIVDSKDYSLEDLLDGITEENRHQEILTGKAVGNEVW